MNMCLKALCCFLLVASGDAAGRVSKKSLAEQKDKGNSMIAKVIEMLGEENEKIKKDLAAEASTMAEYVEWADDTEAEHFYAIKSAKEKIADLTATITDASAEIASLDSEIESLGNEIAERNTEIDEANADRKKSKEEFEKAETEQVAMVEELESMQLALKKQMDAMTTPPPVAAGGEEAAEAGAAMIQAKASPAATFEALLQVSRGHKVTVPAADKDPASLEKLQKAMTLMVNSVWVDPESKKNLATINGGSALVQEDPAAAPAADGGATENLAAFEGLKGKAEESLQKMRDEEVKTQNEHDLNIAALNQAVALAEDKLDDAKKDHARISQEKAEAENEMGETETSKAADEKALESVRQEAADTAAAWDNRQKEAKAEMAAIDKAKEILASRVTVFLQVAQPQPSSSDSSDVLRKQAAMTKLRQKLVNHFRTLGNKIHSIAMLNLVSVSAQDPMENVKNLLKELIEKLTKEAAEAESLHAFCQEEKKKTSAAMKKKQATLDKLNSRLDTAGTKKEQLEEAIATLSEEIAGIDKANAEATKIRTEENTLFTKTEADFSEAAEAVDDAIDALKEYYGDSLLQTAAKKSTNKDDAPPTFGGAKKDSAGGIIGILETMGEEFRKTVKDARAEEREGQKAYDTMMQENKVSKTAKEAEIKGSESEIKSLTVSIHDSTEDKKMTEKEQAAVQDYIDKLKPQCEGRVVPYAERKAKMEAEINGLKEALSILAEESPAGAFSFLQVRQK